MRDQGSKITGFLQCLTAPWLLMGKATLLGRTPSAYGNDDFVKAWMSSQVYLYGQCAFGDHVDETLALEEGE